VEQITCNGVGPVEHPTSTASAPQAGTSVLRADSLEQELTRLDTDAKRARERAEAAFKKKEQQLREGQQARAEYEAAHAATREKTARLQALRLARDAALKTAGQAAQKQPT
jgi:Tfp pilus assembly protein PilX